MLALLPWVFSGSGSHATPPAEQSAAPSLLPHGVLQLPLLATLMGFSALLLGFVSRIVGRRAVNFSLLAGLGLLAGWAGAAYQSWTVLAPLPGPSQLHRAHAVTVVLAVLAAMLLYWGIAHLGLSFAAPCVAVLSFSVGDWLQGLPGSLPATLPVGFGGALLLGLMLGFLGFERAVSLLLWCLCLLLQWLAPAALVVLQRLLTVREELAAVMEAAQRHALHPSALQQVLTSLAVAMVVSVGLLVVRRVRDRHVR